MAVITARPWRGIILGLTAIGAAIPLVVNLTGQALKPEQNPIVLVAGLVAMWAVAVTLFLTMRSSPVPSLETRVRLGWADAGIAVGVGIAGALLVPVLTLGAAQVLGQTELVATAQAVPTPLLVASILTAAVTEEVIYRAAPIELLRARRAPDWLVFVLPWAMFVVAHLGSWNLAHVVGVVMPLGALLTALYLWRRNLTVNITAHAIIDAPLIVVALTAAPAA